MAGKIIADTLEHSTAGSLTTDYVVNGSAKMWGTVDQSATHTIDDSFNLASVTDNGTGRSEFSFSNNMNNAFYCATGMTRDGGGYNDDASVHCDNGGAYSTSSIEITAFFSTTPNDADGALWGLIHGDLA